jgi:hypothetical protein
MLYQDGTTSPQSRRPLKSSTHKLVVGLDTPQYQANALRCHKLHPLSFVLRIARRKLKRPIYSRGFCVAVVHDVVDVTYLTLNLPYGVR